MVFVSDFVFLNHLNPSTQPVFFGGGRVDEQPQIFGCGLLQKERVEQIDLYVSFITLRMLNNTEILHLSVKKTPFHAGFVDDALLVALND